MFRFKRRSYEQEDIIEDDDSDQVDDGGTGASQGWRPPSSRADFFQETPYNSFGRFLRYLGQAARELSADEIYQAVDTVLSQRRSRTSYARGGAVSGYRYQWRGRPKGNYKRAGRRSDEGDFF